MGIANSQLLGGQSIKQHFVLLLAGRHLSAENFKRLSTEIEKTLFVWLITGTSAKEYELRILDAARRLRAVPNETFQEFIDATLVADRRSLKQTFERSMNSMRYHDTRQFRLRYLLAKITQYVDLQAYGPSESRSNLADYTAGGNDIEHILPDSGDEDAITEFGAGGADQETIQSLGNLLLIEKSINRSISNKRYSEKSPAYGKSKFLLTRCQVSIENNVIGSADRITKVVQSLEHYPVWNVENVRKRQVFLTKLSCIVWGL